MNNNIIQFTNFKYSEDDIMCKILKELNGLKPNDLLTKYGISSIPPINISLLLKKIGIAAIPYDFSKIEDIMKYDRGDVLGVIFAKNDTLSIFYRISDTSNRQRFTLAHEIAHCCLHSDSLEKRHIELRSSLNVNDAKEYYANIFAGELLIPKDILTKIHNKFIIAPPLSEISKIFGVSTTVMAARLDYLNMPYIKDKQTDEY